MTDCGERQPLKTLNNYHRIFTSCSLFILFTDECLNIMTMAKTKKILVLTGGGDCPGLNAVIRGIAKRARKEKGWEVYGSIEAFNGVFAEPQEVFKLTSKNTAGIHVKGGTISEASA